MPAPSFFFEGPGARFGEPEFDPGDYRSREFLRYDEIKLAEKLPKPKTNPAFLTDLSPGAHIAKLDAAFNSTTHVQSKIVSFEGEEVGALTHVDNQQEFYGKIWFGLLNLRNAFDKNDNEALIPKIYKYFEETLDSGLYDVDKIKTFLKLQREKFEDLEVPDFDDDGKPKATDYYAGLFTLGREIKTDIRHTEALKRELSNLHNFQVTQLRKAKTELAELEARLPAEHRELSVLNQKRQESLADYQVARLLIAEDWSNVEAAYNQRNRALNFNKGLYYARVRETPINKVPASNLPLRPGRIEDLVPGYPLVDGELPDELEPFIDAILDIPVNDWTALSKYAHLLPSRRSLSKMMGVRDARLHYLANRPLPYATTPLAHQLYAMRGFNLAILRQHSRRYRFDTRSLVAYQRQASKVLSLEDLLSGPPHRLRGLVQKQRNKIDQATHSLISVLQEVSPAIRLDWAKDAELDELELTKPSTWPGLAKAEAQDLNGIRTLIELVEWWWRQLDDDADSNSTTALRNLLRAVLMYAASDDPEQILSGQLMTTPSVLKPGEALRVTLNKETLPGTQLQLVSNTNELVATLRVDDMDDKGAVTTLTKLHRRNIKPNTRFTVSGYRRHFQLR